MKGNYGRTDVAPFNLTSVLTMEVGNAAVETIKSKLWDEFKASELGELYNKNAYTEEEIAQLRDNITEKMMELLGPFQYLLIEIPFISWVEDKAGDMALGESAEEIQAFARELELPEYFFEKFCEGP